MRVEDVGVQVEKYRGLNPIKARSEAQARFQLELTRVGRDRTLGGGGGGPVATLEADEFCVSEGAIFGHVSQAEAARL